MKPSEFVLGPPAPTALVEFNKLATEVEGLKAQRDTLERMIKEKVGKLRDAVTAMNNKVIDLGG